MYFFLICLSCSFQNDQKHTLFFHFCTPKLCTCVQCLVLKNNPNYVNFWTSLIPLDIRVPTPATLGTQRDSNFSNLNVLQSMVPESWRIGPKYSREISKFKYHPMVLTAIYARGRNLGSIAEKYATHMTRAITIKAYLCSSVCPWRFPRGGGSQT